MHHVRSSDLNPRGQLFWTILITAAVGLLALQRSSSPLPEGMFQQTSLGGLPASSLTAAPLSQQPATLDGFAPLGDDATPAR